MYSVAAAALVKLDSPVGALLLPSLSPPRPLLFQMLSSSFLLYNSDIFINVFLERAHQDEQNGTTKIVESQMDAGLNVSNTILPLICEQNDENRRVNG